MVRKLKSCLLMFTFALALIPSFNFNAYAADGERRLRVGECWCDGQANCRKKKNGATCETRNNCAALPCVQIGGIIIGAGAVLAPQN